MQYRVEELAETAGVAVDTIRFYQRRGLLDQLGPDARVIVLHAYDLPIL